jgi:hypothetical protein
LIFAQEEEKLEEIEKDRDIGYVLAANSCEGVNDVETCTIAVLDVITAFAVPNPSFSSQRLPVFSGLAASESPRLATSLSLLRTGNCLLKPTLSAVDATKNKGFRDYVNAQFWCNWEGDKTAVNRLKTLDSQGLSKKEQKRG